MTKSDSKTAHPRSAAKGPAGVKTIKGPSQTPPGGLESAPQADRGVPAPPGPSGKLGQLVALLAHPDGMTIAQAIEATGWQAHSVRGAMSGALKKNRGLTVSSEKTEAGRVYRIVVNAGQ